MPLAVRWFSKDIRVDIVYRLEIKMMDDHPGSTRKGSELDREVLPCKSCG